MCSAAEWRGGGALARCVRVGSRARGSPETHRQAGNTLSPHLVVLRSAHR